MVSDPSPREDGAATPPYASPFLRERRAPAVEITFFLYPMIMDLSQALYLGIAPMYVCIIAYNVVLLYLLFLLSIHTSDGCYFSSPFRNAAVCL